METTRQIFISHANSDLEIAKRLHTDLKEAGATPWMEEIDLVHGQNRKQFVPRAIRESDYFLALISSDSVSKKGDAQCHMKKALVELESLPPDGIYIIPVRLDDCELIDEKIRDLKSVDLFKSYEAGLEAILRIVGTKSDDEKNRRAKQIRPRPLDVERIYLEIEKTGNRHRGCLHWENSQTGPFFPMNLDPDTKIHTGEKPIRLKDSASDDNPKVQLAVGQYLYKQVFGDVHPSEAGNKPNMRIELGIVTDDDYVAKLPWVLTAHEDLFLSLSGWSFFLASDMREKDLFLPETPKLLIIAPEPAGMERTGAKSHVEDLEYRLSFYNDEYSRGGGVKIVDRWEDVANALESFQPELVYFYGRHSKSNDGLRLIFSQKDGNRPAGIRLEEFVESLIGTHPPHLVYFNFCGGIENGFLDVARQLGKTVPAVIVNHTVADLEIAKRQAMIFWTGLLLDGLQPHEATFAIPGRLDEDGGNTRAMVPLLLRHYGFWDHTPKKKDPFSHDPLWHLKLDRVVQFGTVSFQTREMLRNRRPRMLAYVWYGMEGQGNRIFHRRLKIELQEDLRDHAHFVEVLPEWPMDVADAPERSFADMMCEAFDVKEFDDIPQKIRSKTQGASGLQTLVSVRHRTVTTKKPINPNSLKKYLKWMDGTFAPMLEKRHFLLVGISFVVDNPAKFRKAVIEKEKLYDLRLGNSVFRLLDEMERLGMKDLHDFLQTHNIRLPEGKKDIMLQEIMEQTGGHYRQTIGALKQLVRRAADIVEEKSKETEISEEEFDY